MIMTASQVDSLTDEDVKKLFNPQVYYSDEGYGAYTHFRILKDNGVSAEIMTALTVRSQSILGFLDNGEPIHMSKLFSDHDSEQQDDDDFDVMINNMINDEP
ncbi:hypothetical protein N8Z77_05620 [Planktomarina sp.]|nr:hypothetical protein [Planktomarina sp.]